MTPAPSMANSAPSSSAGSNRLASLPLPRLWWLWGILLSTAVVALGWSAKSVPGFSTNEFTVDQELSRNHEAVLTAVAMVLNTAFSPVGGVVIIAILGLFLWLGRRAPLNALVFCAVSCLGWVASEVFKLIIARHRPDQSLLFDPLAPETGSNSFPSGHTALAVALAFALYFLARGTRWSVVAVVGGTVMALLVAWSRVYIGVHYPSDVLASFLASTAAVLIFGGLWNKFAPALLPRIQRLFRTDSARNSATS